jgi:dephospho-CoA kinase
VKVIGLMGAVGAGKSTVAGMLLELGALVHDADRAVHDTWKEPEVKEAALRLLGDGILRPDGEVDRAAVAERVFPEPARLKALEDLLHPRVRRRMEAWLSDARARGTKAAVLDVPLLMETGLDGLCDVLLFVEASEGLREIRTAGARGWPAGEAARRQSRQGDLAAKRAKAHAVISNAGDLAETRRQTHVFWKQRIQGGQDP